MSAAVDTLIGRVKRDVVVGAASAAAATDAADAALLHSALGRFAVTKHSWRGRYRRLLAVTPEALVTQHPDTLAVTNVWRYSLTTSPTATTSSSSNANRGSNGFGSGVEGSVLLFDAGDVESVSVGKAAPPGFETGDLELTLSVRSDSKVKKGEREKERERGKEGKKRAGGPEWVLRGRALWGPGVQVGHQRPFPHYTDWVQGGVGQVARKVVPGVGASTA